MILYKHLSFMLIPLTALLAFCTTQQVSPITGIILKWQMTGLDKQTDRLIPLSGSNRLYFKEGMTIYLKEDVFLDFDNKPHPEFNYWIYKSGSNDGLWYNKKVSNKGMKFNVDSFLRQNAFLNAAFFSKDDSLLYASIGKDKEIVSEKYYSKYTPDETYSDTTTFYFDTALNSVPYSLSPELEMLKKSKVVKISVLFRALPANPLKSLRKVREWIFEIAKINVDESFKIPDYFDQFELESKNLQ